MKANTATKDRHSHTSQTPTLAISGPLRIETVGRWLPEIKGLLSKRASATLDLRQMTEIDTIGLQLLCAAQREASRLRHPLAMENGPRCLHLALQAIGLDTHALFQPQPSSS